MCARPAAGATGRDATTTNANVFEMVCICIKRDASVASAITWWRVGGMWRQRGSGRVLVERLTMTNAIERAYVENAYWCDVKRVLVMTQTKYRLCAWDGWLDI